MAMTLRSDPTNPAARARCGDYAVQQNKNDRSKTAINDAMDNTFKPVHTSWSGLWSTQQQAENAVSKAVKNRDTADKAFDDAIRRILRALLDSLGKDSPELKEYLPGGSLESLPLPLSDQLSKFTAYAPVIAAASDATIPQATRDNFAAKYQEAQAAQAALDAAKQAAIAAQQAREAADPGWDKAYLDYRRAVEHELEDNRTLIKTFILEWPA